MAIEAVVLWIKPTATTQVGPYLSGAIPFG